MPMTITSPTTSGAAASADVAGHGVELVLVQLPFQVDRAILAEAGHAVKLVAASSAIIR